MQNTASIAVRSLRQVRSPLQLAGRKRTWHRSFHSSRRLDLVKPFLLADIGEGITEVQIIQWFVQPGARVEQFDKLCEVQSDKASVEITSRYDGIVKRLHYDQDDTAKVGKALCDIDVNDEEAPPKDEPVPTPEGQQAGTPSDAQQPQKAAEKKVEKQEEPAPPKKVEPTPPRPSESKRPPGNKHVSNLATPAVRGLLKELGVNIEDVQGTGRDGRVLKEDVHSFVASRDSNRRQSASSGQTATKPRPAMDHGPQQETPVSLTPIQAQMFKVMTRSLSIPHFLYADEIDMSRLSSLRRTLNTHPSSPSKLSFLPFVIKAVSLALHDFPLLNARVDIPSSPTSSSPPKLVLRAKHNIGVAMDTPQGLLVPNIKNVAALSIQEISEHLAWLAQQARAGKLTAADLTGGTITVSNIGNIGGTYVSPVIVQSEVAILGMGKARVVPAFADAGAPEGTEAAMRVVRKTVANFSWSADHRVVDGATMARMAERVRVLVEEPGLMMAGLR